MFSLIKTKLETGRHISLFSDMSSELALNNSASFMSVWICLFFVTIFLEHGFQNILFNKLKLTVCFLDFQHLTWAHCHYWYISFTSWLKRRLAVLSAHELQFYVCVSQRSSKLDSLAPCLFEIYHFATFLLYLRW